MTDSDRETPLPAETGAPTLPYVLVEAERLRLDGMNGGASTEARRAAYEFRTRSDILILAEAERVWGLSLYALGEKYEDNLVIFAAANILWRSMKNFRATPARGTEKYQEVEHMASKAHGQKPTFTDPIPSAGASWALIEAGYAFMYEDYPREALAVVSRVNQNPDARRGLARDLATIESMALRRRADQTLQEAHVLQQRATELYSDSERIRMELLTAEQPQTSS